MESESETEISSPVTPEAAEQKPPNPMIVVLISLFGYPGMGHFLCGARTLGVVIGLVFTGLTIGIIYEIWQIAMPLYRLMTQAIPMEIAPNWARMGFWIVTTGILWIGAALHSYALATKLNSN